MALCLRGKEGVPQGQGFPVWCRLKTTRNIRCQGVGKVRLKERFYKKGGPPGRGGVASGGLRKDSRFSQTDMDLPKR